MPIRAIEGAVAWTLSVLLLAHVVPVKATERWSSELSPRAHDRKTAAESESSDGIVGIVSPCGLFLAGGKEQARFLTLLPANRVAFLPPARPRYWVVDDALLESVLTSESEMKLPSGKFRGVELLRRHRAWQATWTARQHSWHELDLREIRIVPPQGSRNAYSIWTYKVPASMSVFGQPVSDIVALSVAIGGVVLVITIALRPRENEAERVSLLQKAVDGLETYSNLDRQMNTVELIRSVSTETKTCAMFLNVMNQRLPRSP